MSHRYSSTVLTNTRQVKYNTNSCFNPLLKVRSPRPMAILVWHEGSMLYLAKHYDYMFSRTVASRVGLGIPNSGIPDSVVCYSVALDKL